MGTGWEHRHLVGNMSTGLGAQELGPEYRHWIEKHRYKLGVQAQELGREHRHWFGSTDTRWRAQTHVGNTDTELGNTVMHVGARTPHEEHNPACKEHRF